MEELRLLFEDVSRDRVTTDFLTDVMDVAEDHGVPLTAISVGGDDGGQ